jgi:hypothetical protein
MVEIYRGVGIHDQQPSERIENVVKPRIDYVMALDDVGELYEIARDVRSPPEARLLAAAKCEAHWSLAASERRVRPGVDLSVTRAIVAGLDSAGWRDPDRYASLLCPAGAVPRAVPLQ